MRTVLIALAFAALAACGQTAPQSDSVTPSPIAGIDVSDARAAPTPGGVQVSAGYLTIANANSEEDRLIGASSERAGRVEIHEMIMDGAVMQMRPVTDLVIPGGGEVILAPGGRHLMFYDVTAPFTEGESVPIQLTFANAGEINVSLPVRRTEHGAH